MQTGTENKNDGTPISASLVSSSPYGIAINGMVIKNAHVNLISFKYEEKWTNKEDYFLAITDNSFAFNNLEGGNKNKIDGVVSQDSKFSVLGITYKQEDTGVKLDPYREEDYNEVKVFYTCKLDIKRTLTTDKGKNS